MTAQRSHPRRQRWWLLVPLPPIIIAAMVFIATIVSDASVGDSHLTMSAPVTPILIAEGAYVARVADCSGCHSVEGRPPYSGGLRMQTPVGTLISSNITPDPAHGIGRWTFGEFDRAIRFGVSPQHTLYPAMPFTSYARFTRHDVEALFAYFRYGVTAEPRPVPPNDIPFPLSLRSPLTIWRWSFAPEPKPFAGPHGGDVAIARGAYLTEVGGHCGECHTPRGWGLQPKALSTADGEAFLSGGSADGWFAPSLRNERGGLAVWTRAMIADFLLTGQNSSGAAFGGMTDAVKHGTSHLSRADALAIASFLKSLTGSSNVPWKADAASAAALRRGDVGQRGSLTYLNNCAACHRSDGMGYQSVFPALAGNPVVESNDPTSLIRIVLEGATTIRGASRPAQFSMPAFEERLDDVETANVVTFIRRAWGNDASFLTPRQVSRVRMSLKRSNP